MRPSRWRDLGAGLCVAGLLIPEAVAYSGLAGLPVVHALTATLVGLAVYAIFGGSRFAIVAPTSSAATLSAAAVLSIPGTAGQANTSVYLQALLALVLLAGLALALLGWAKQGQLSAFVSRPVLRGFAFALAITIIIRQLPDALGLTLPHEAGVDPFRVFLFAATHVRDWHLPTVLIACLAGALIVALRRWPQVPASMIVIVLAILAAGALDLNAYGVAEVGTVPRPAWNPGFPNLPLDAWLRLGELAFGLVVLVFAESWGSMRSLALSHGGHLNADRELVVLGGANMVSALLQGMPVGAGFSASSANAAAGASSRWAGAMALAVIVASLAFALPALHLLPRPVLAVAVISALWHALSPGPLIAVWRMNRDRLLVVGSVAAVLCFGVLHGMLAAIALSLLAALKRFSQPVLHELGELGATRDFVVLDGHTGAASVPGALILRPEETLFFASAERVVSAVIHTAESRTAVRYVVLSLEESSDLDSTAAECLLELDKRLAGDGKTLILARVKDSVRGLLRYLDPEGLGNEKRMFWSVADAADHVRGQHGAQVGFRDQLDG
ncbi:MAG: SulP family inorganic anion transporter [Pseudomonadota bacterium]